MSADQYRVVFLPEDIEVQVEQGASLLEAALTAGVHINASCGGTGVCGTCKVKLISGSLEYDLTGKLNKSEFDQGFRQACRSRVISDLTVEIPLESRLDQAIQARENQRSEGVSALNWKYAPPLQKYFLELAPATLDDNVSDLFRIRRGLKQHYQLENLLIDFEVIRRISPILRENDFRVTATVLTYWEQDDTQSQKIINIEAGDTRDHLYALAIDVGTTTICSQLLDLNRGKILADTIVFNKQISYGSDVITRIAYSQKPGGLQKLQELVAASINDTIGNLLKTSHLKRTDIGYISAAGNTVMQQLLLGLDPKYIRLSPYTPTANLLPLVKAADLGIKVEHYVYLYTFPSVSSYVGGDIVSGVIATGIHQRKNLTLYMDLGTNGEIVIGNSDWMVTASCSAGPAFEGGGIKFGMVALKGAIQDFTIDPETLEPEIKTIGDAKPRGICGSGLINTVAELLEAGVIGQNGKFNTHLQSKRIRLGADIWEYVLAWAPETQIGQDIVLTEVDIDNLIRAKAAMYAGCHTLSRAVNVDCSDFEQVILAGNFGSSLNIEKAVTIGLLPDIPRDRFVFVGNGSLSGARLVNFSQDLLKDSTRVSGMMTNIELSENIEFNDNYIAALFLPHTDTRAFPNINKSINQKNHSFKKEKGVWS
jgi:uncharacterized 2Fe-2S/4Fe-4S cluster protein (DUF4445 family)